MNPDIAKPTCIDLFCGCGGFSLGMQRAGFAVVAAIDASPIATGVFDRNFPAVPFVLCEDLTGFSPDRLAGLLAPVYELFQACFGVG
jgi:DNA (cytosine-5)-methyltransferase 1